MSGQIVVVKGDITKVKVDAIVNPANFLLLPGGGVSGAIHRAEGKDLRKRCKKAGILEPGKAIITQAFNIPAKFIIHTVSYPYYFGEAVARMVLEKCYISSMRVAEENSIKSIAFPLIGTGHYGFPLQEASNVMVSTIGDYIRVCDYDVDVKIVCFCDGDYEILSDKISE